MEKEPIALLVNDLHASKDNIPEFNANWDEALSLCEKYGVSDLIVGGDLWQSRSAQTLDVLMAVRDALIKAVDKGVEVTLANGNHDKVNQEEILGYSHVFSRYPYVYVINDYCIFDLSPDAVLYVMSYFPENGSFQDRLAKIVEGLEEGKKNILYCHQGIRGGLSTSSEDELPASIFEPFDKVLVGHYHNRAIVPGTSIEYIGASRQHNFGEDEEKGYTVVYSDGSTLFEKNEANKRYKVVKADLKKVESGLMEELRLISEDERYKVKVQIKCDCAEIPSVDKQKIEECGAAKVEFLTDQDGIALAEPESLSKKFDKAGIKEEYVGFCQTKEIAPALGLKYLDKIN